MALVINATWGSSVANSYVSVTNATSFLATTLDSSLWESLTTDYQPKCLLAATRSIDQMRWHGSRYFPHQTLEFPRSLIEVFPFASDVNTFSFEWTRMITHVEQACSMQAVWEHLQLKQLDHRIPQFQGIRNMSQGGSQVNESYSYSGDVIPLAPDVFHLLAPWQGTRRVFRG